VSAGLFDLGFPSKEIDSAPFSFDAIANAAAHAVIHASGVFAFYPVTTRRASVKMPATLYACNAVELIFRGQSTCPTRRIRITMK